MRVLFVHSDRIAFEATAKADEAAEEAEGAGQNGDAERGTVPAAGELEDCVTAFVAVEPLDGSDVDAAVAAAKRELGDLADSLNTDRIALYPCPLLSDDRADTTTAATVLGRVEAALDGEYDVLRAPVGWHASFEVSCKGHPLSTGVRTVDPDRGADRERSASEWYLITPDGERRDPTATNADLGAALRRVVAAEVTGERPNAGPAADEGQSVAETLSRAGLAADSGPGAGRTWLPRGAFVRDRLTAYADDLVREFGGLPVETPRAYDLDAEAVRAHAAAFGGRGGRVDSGKRHLFLRPAHCLGHCSLLATADLDASDLPVRLYESGDAWNAPNSRDHHRSVDVVPEMHTAVADTGEAREAFRRQATLVREANAALETAAVPVLRVTEEFHAGHEEWVETLVADGDGPTLVEVVPDRPGCWSARLDLVATDAGGRSIETGTVRLDRETAARFGVEFSDGSRTRTPTLLHCSPTGPLDDALRAVLSGPEREGSELLTWLAPTQVRLIPVDGDHLGTCDDVVDRLTDAGVRADVDDRAAPVGDRLARADDERVPHVAVVGDRERNGEPLRVTNRATGRERTTDVDELARTVREATAAHPARERYGPRRVSETLAFGE
ncbi:threonyl-tRNA synthetase editing domain-containing protein [Halostella sp. PRR32]|uniref:threonyl-tRNA synthetase editing domain-containing protein n=1 Tax=Halostella sp. PRR32 TaxID=3098147 RepID=UPI002B1D7B48|nr:threonyl-tRNA synthetase editing domain-containing protein [Halostella sp. PRR32]